MAWGRLVSLKIGIGNPGTDSDAVDLSAYHISFNVRRSRSYQDNHATFTVFNVGDEVRKKFLVAGATVMFGAGYADESASLKQDGVSAPTIFWGYVTLASTKKVGINWESKIDAKICLGLHEPPTTKTTKKKKDGSTKTKVVPGKIAAADHVFLEMNYAKGTSYQTIIRDICDQLALVPIGIEKLGSISAKNGFKDQGGLTGILARIKHNLEDYGFSIYEEANDGLIIYEIGTKPSNTALAKAVVLSYETGLLGLEELESEIITPSAIERKSWNLKEEDKQLILKKIRFQSLLNPEITPNTSVMVKTSTLNEGYIVDAVEYEGDNFGGEFNLTGQAVG